MSVLQSERLVTVKIGMRSIKTDGADEHERKAGVLFDMLHSDNFKTNLENIPDFGVQVTTISEVLPRIDGNAFVSEETWEIHAVPSNDPVAA